MASHVRRVRVPSNVDQFSDVDQYLDDLFSPVLDGSLDELSDARSLSTSIRGGRSDFFEAPEIGQNFDDLKIASKLQRVIKGGGHKNDSKKTEVKRNDNGTDEIVHTNEISLDEYITGGWLKFFVFELIRIYKGQITQKITFFIDSCTQAKNGQL